MVDVDDVDSSRRGADAFVLWLLRRTLGFPPSVAALGALLAVLALIGALWWVRWRGLQRTWARARLVAEVSRSQVTAAVFPRLPVRRMLDTPALCWKCVKPPTNNHGRSGG